MGFYSLGCLPPWGISPPGATPGHSLPAVIPIKKVRQFRPNKNNPTGTERKTAK